MPFSYWALQISVNISTDIFYLGKRTGLKLGERPYLFIFYTPNANMADHSVGARDESNESEASWASMFCFDNAFPEKSCFVVDLVPLFRPPYAFLCS